MRAGKAVPGKSWSPENLWKNRTIEIQLYYCSYGNNITALLPTRELDQITTTDLHGICTQRHTGTSASAPLVSGMIALGLEEICQNSFETYDWTNFIILKQKIRSIRVYHGEMYSILFWKQQSWMSWKLMISGKMQQALNFRTTLDLDLFASKNL